MALVPDGEVVVEGFDAALLDDMLEPDQPNVTRGTVVEVQRVFLDRYPVTNRQFWYFVKEGGYQHMALWDPEVWPAVLDFVDRTGEPGPAVLATLASIRAAKTIIRSPVCAGTRPRRMPVGPASGCQPIRNGSRLEVGPSCSRRRRVCSGAIPGATRWTASGPTCGTRDRAAS